LADVMGPTPTVGGMTTKLLASVPDKETWDGTLARPGIRQFNKTPFVDAIIKIEQPQYEGIAALENLCLQLHARMGFEVPRRWLIEIEGMRVLAVERFDRDNHGYPLAYESILTVLSGGSRSITRSNDIELKQLAEKIRKLAKIAAIDVKRTLQEIFKRFAVSLMTGNGDMHLDNIGFLGDSTKSRIAPVFDPAPMRAWPRHNLRMAVPIAFENGSPIYEQIARTGMNFGFTKAQAVEELRRAKDMTQDYTKLLMSLAKVPKDRKLNLVEIVNKERELLGLLG
jgi:serine/threonine-protein kinase HipA